MTLIGTALIGASLAIWGATGCGKKEASCDAVFEHVKELAHSVIRLEKPAHTRYLLIPIVETMRIGQRAQPPAPPPGITLPTAYFVRVGVNTRLGIRPGSPNPV